LYDDYTTAIGDNCTDQQDKAENNNNNNNNSNSSIAGSSAPTLVFLCAQKYSSNVIEKLMSVCGSEVGALTINTLIAVNKVWNNYYLNNHPELTPGVGMLPLNGPPVRVDHSNSRMRYFFLYCVYCACVMLYVSLFKRSCIPFLFSFFSCVP
jgi:hypothetical protein